MYDLIVRNARLYPMLAGAEPAAEASLAVTEGRIVALGVDELATAKETFDADGRCVLPGFIDCHTHALYAGDRMAEHALRLSGAGYEEIARAGGGILSTVEAVRTASEPQLIRETLPRLAALAAEGVTCVEVKSGYGLDLASELKMLRALRQLRDRVDVELVATFLGAHAIPPGRSRDDYLEEVVERMLPAVADEGLAATVDIFIEGIAFDLDDARRLFARARELGFSLRAHTEQLTAMGGTRVAAEHGALSCDHLEYAVSEDLRAMREHGSVAVLLPGAFYFLRETRLPPIAEMRSLGVPIAVASDLNPGSSPIASLLTAMHMAATIFRLTPEEVLLGVTRHAAAALGRADELGSLAPGRRADFCVWDLPAPEFLVYQLGGLAPDAVFVAGRRT